MKEKGGLMDYAFVLFFLIGAIGIQLGNGWLAKNEFGIRNFLLMVPLLLVAQYFVAWGYNAGTTQQNFITAHVVWTLFLVGATLAVNYLMFGNIPGAAGLVALVLAAIATVIAVMGGTR
ncbi:MAG: hypothetical protein WC488_03635 [Candidatus Micrarchaeia archaeon]